MKNLIFALVAMSCIGGSRSFAAQGCLVFLTDSEGLTFRGSDPNIGMGVTMDRHFRSIKWHGSKDSFFEVHTALVGGSNPFTWNQDAWPDPFQMVTYEADGIKREVHGSEASPFPAPGIDQQFKKCGAHEPKIVVIEGGANMMGDSDRNGRYKEDNNLVDKHIKGSGFYCIWIGPPRLGELKVPRAKYNSQNAKFRQILDRAGGCMYLTSENEVDPKNLPDQTEFHYDPKYGTEWAKKIFPNIDPVIAKIIQKYEEGGGVATESNPRIAFPWPGGGPQ